MENVHNFADHKQRLLKSSAEFIRDFVAPDYLIDGPLQRQFCYSCTGLTGSGKTAVALNLAACVALGRPFGELEVERGRVLYLAGENPIDVQMRWIAMAQQMDFNVDDVDVHFIAGVFKISELRDVIKAEVRALGGVSLVIIDTSAAYFEGDEENSNVQMGNYARMQRSLVELPGGPTILSLCHPVKNAGEDNLLPRGGGAYLNEVDGNLTIRNGDAILEVHWQGKYRGIDFAPMPFHLRTVTHERLKDKKGRLIRTVIAEHLSEAAEKALADASRARENQLLAAIAKNPNQPLVEYAKSLGWISSKTGEPLKTSVKRTLERLKSAKLAENGRGGPQITEKGLRELQR